MQVYNIIYIGNEYGSCHPSIYVLAPHQISDLIITLSKNIYVIMKMQGYNRKASFFNFRLSKMAAPDKPCDENLSHLNE